jgi:hypothetical protein
VNPVPEKVCGSDAGFLTELATVSDLAQAKVQYEWALAIPGTAVPGRPTIGEPTFAVAGKLVDWIPPMSDLNSTFAVLVAGGVRYQAGWCGAGLRAGW